MRHFGTGASRDDDSSKLDFEGFLSPRVLERYARYMDGHRVQADGTKRGSDNWQLGIPIEAYQKSLVRHVFQCWSAWRGENPTDDRGEPIDLEDSLCSVIFNASGLLFELLRDSQDSSRSSSSGTPSP